MEFGNYAVIKLFLVQSLNHRQIGIKTIVVQIL